MGTEMFHRCGTRGRGEGTYSKAINNMMACVNGLAMMEGLALG